MRFVEFKHASEFRDVEAINMYKKLLSEGKTEEEAFRFVAPGTRDQTRAPMQWTSDANGGFTTGTPWLRLNDNFDTVNAADEDKDPDSILNFYRAAIRERKQHKTLVYGDFVPVCPEQKDFFGYTREDADGKYYVEINLSAHELERPVEMNGTLLLGSYGTAEKALRPFEANLYRLR